MLSLMSSSALKSINLLVNSKTRFLVDFQLDLTTPPIKGRVGAMKCSSFLSRPKERGWTYSHQSPFLMIVKSVPYCKRNRVPLSSAIWNVPVFYLAIAPKRHWQRNDPIIAQRKYTQPSLRAGNHAKAGQNRFSLYWKKNAVDLNHSLCQALVNQIHWKRFHGMGLIKRQRLRYPYFNTVNTVSLANTTFKVNQNLTVNCAFPSFLEPAGMFLGTISYIMQTSICLRSNGLVNL